MREAEQAARHRESANAKRERRCDQATEEPEAEQEQEGQGKNLGALDIGRDDVLDLNVSRRLAAKTHPPLVTQLLVQTFGGELLVAVGESREIGDHEGGPAVPRDHRRVIGRPVGGYEGDVGIEEDAVGDSIDPPPRGFATHRPPGPHQCHQPDVGVEANRLVNAFGGYGAVGVGIGRAIGMEPVRDAGPQRKRQRSAQRRTYDDMTGPPLAETGEAVEQASARAQCLNPSPLTAPPSPWCPRPGQY